MVSTVFYKAVSDTEESFIDFSDQTLKTVSALHDIQKGGLRIVASTTEVVLDRVSNPKTGAVQERENTLIKNGAAKLREGFKRYSDLVEKFFPDETEFRDQIKTATDDLINGSAVMVETVMAGARGKEIHEAKERFETDEQNFLKAVARALDHENEEIAEVQENIRSNLARTNAFILAGLIAITVIILLLTWLLSNRIVR
ncbi:MAG: hypothetical protein O2912_03030 [Proteobacteria bacterium]|nr:hypothetical protein [Pseudomonadota bacterium]